MRSLVYKALGSLSQESRRRSETSLGRTCQIKDLDCEHQKKLPNQPWMVRLVGSQASLTEGQFKVDC